MANKKEKATSFDLEYNNSDLYDQQRYQNNSKTVDDEKPDLSKEGIINYSSLSALNLVPGLRKMTPLNWSFYLLGALAWTVDAMDFFVVSVSTTEIAAFLNKSVTDITWGITLVLMLCSVGAIIFGLASDYYGRKWPFIVCCFCFVVLELGCGFVQTLEQFLAVRALFGIAMGGMYGNAAATALEDQPVEARSILSGCFLPCYNFGYLLAVVFSRAFLGTYKTNEDWRSLLWFTAGPPLLLIAWRLMLPESKFFLDQKEAKRLHNATLTEDDKKHQITAWTQAKDACRTHWLMFIYLIFLLAGFNFSSHGSQDLYSTMLVKQRNFDADDKTMILCVINIGAMVGGLVFGQLTDLLGRRLSIVVCCIGAGALIYPAFLLHSITELTVGGFWLQFFIMGNWGIVPVHLFELCPSNYRTFASGLVYQLGNLASSASSTIESQLGSRFPITNSDGTPGYDYGKVMGIFTGAVMAYIMVCVIVGPERFHKDLQHSILATQANRGEATEEIEFEKPSENYQESQPIQR
ncbi:MFS general substrate transporter [Ascoidea rubescens DSM 1968]|uniref:MFS general substrate transporter n=1 Tax=Ascoidea rubescens DSM 1968 TaxID=1344418 RepID=A0A1D2V963_9ASCO|nr:MFS general substrate transporter [Ascoidea rubescens DSM 1968]ODV58201.1 MFS general substrate transporter [Ascoidea rubescens DSM 1968]